MGGGGFASGSSCGVGGGAFVSVDGGNRCGGALHFGGSRFAFGGDDDSAFAGVGSVGGVGGGAFTGIM